MLVLTSPRALLGSSIGAIMAMALAFNYHPTVIREMLERTVCAVFRDRVAPLRVSRARWSNHILSLLCQEMWAGKCVNDASLKVLVSALTLDNNAKEEERRSVEVHVFHNFTGKEDAASTVLASDAVMRSSAAPSYFPAWQGYIGSAWAATRVCVCVLVSDCLSKTTTNDNKQTTTTNDNNKRQQTNDNNKQQTTNTRCWHVCP
jgi:hypothetical protein